MGKQYRWVTQQDIDRLRLILSENKARQPPLTNRQLIAQWGKDYTTFHRYKWKIEAGEPITLVTPMQKNCKGVVKELFEVLIDQQQLALTEIAQKLGVSTAAVSYWYAGLHLPTSFNLECLAELAGFKLTLQPLEQQQ